MIRTVIFAIEQLTTFGLGLFNLHQIRVDQIANIIRIECAPMIVDYFPVKFEHVRTILGDLVASGLLAGQILYGRYVVDGMNFAEQTHTLFDQEGESLEFGIIDRETNRHHNATDDIADGHRIDGTQIDRSTL